MGEHLRKSEAELNELLMEYWKLRHETGNNYYSFNRRGCVHHSIISVEVYMETLANKLNMNVSSE